MTVETPIAPAESVSTPTEDLSSPFARLGLQPDLLRAVLDLGYEEPTPIQARTIPLMLDGRDVVAQAQTGTGKTAAFALPILQRIDTASSQVQALVLCPTRELAIQVAQAIHSYGKHLGVTVLPVYGGQPITRQLYALRQGVQVVVGTPGRILDHIRRESLDLGSVKTLVLDEADEMLDMGFLEDIEAIIQSVPAERQTALFSATLPQRIRDLARKYLRESVNIAIEREAVTVPQTNQTYYEVPQRAKLDALCRILDVELPSSAIIFCARKSDVDELVESLQGRGYKAEAIHGDLNQTQRDRVMKSFRDGKTEILVATDVAARGLDIPQVSHVINYHIPWDPESYVHRIGRTGRAGREGTAITLISPREYRQLKLIERVIRKRIRASRLPSLADVEARRREVLIAQVRGALDEGGIELYREAAEELSDELDPLDVAAAALKLLANVDRKAELSRGGSVADAGVDAAEPGMSRLFVNLGRNEGIRPADIVGAIAGEAGIPGRVIGAIDLYDTYTFVEVPQESARKVVDALNRATLRGRPIRAEIARPRGK
ncbi:MAG TPA: DEAD/DEAH box helicase [Chloroflexota bacterium]|nr:DEAD/DEAH box helicase [Chloroflexota bacterium]